MREAVLCVRPEVMHSCGFLAGEAAVARAATRFRGLPGAQAENLLDPANLKRKRPKSDLWKRKVGENW